MFSNNKIAKTCDVRPILLAISAVINETHLYLSVYFMANVIGPKSEPETDYSSWFCKRRCYLCVMFLTLCTMHYCKWTGDRKLVSGGAGLFRWFCIGIDGWIVLERPPVSSISPPFLRMYSRVHEEFQEGKEMHFVLLPSCTSRYSSLHVQNELMKIQNNT